MIRMRHCALHAIDKFKASQTFSRRKQQFSAAKFNSIYSRMRCDIEFNSTKDTISPAFSCTNLAPIYPTHYLLAHGPAHGSNTIFSFATVPMALHIQYITNSVNALNEEKNTINGKQSVASSATLFSLIYNTLREYKLVAMTALWSRRVCVLRTIFEYFRFYVTMRLIQLIQYERNICVVVAFNNNSSRCHGQRHIASQHCVAYWAEIKILENDMI